MSQAVLTVSSRLLREVSKNKCCDKVSKGIHHTGLYVKGRPQQQITGGKQKWAAVIIGVFGALM